MLCVHGGKSTSGMGVVVGGIDVCVCVCVCIMQVLVCYRCVNIHSIPWWCMPTNTTYVFTHLCSHHTIWPATSHHTTNPSPHSDPNLPPLLGKPTVRFRNMVNVLTDDGVNFGVNAQHYAVLVRDLPTYSFKQYVCGV